ncbi:LLM class flavin-dependent oxidoreductase [Sporosarcina ureilytica]|uniref:5,10-methylene tetrahydromethanopterin reductase n=1 Tax=Sporosarcina ureilytica TaxID=298596 RepID=A0A1D8JIZ9_9BACL|nr:LLM class flavin-dependent oxidoreductase [Sporosarcina ureilytica]AOV08682.1 5,10-methylene tetrahydromethanopterin reductase [Sporosarcina ureilytica]
MTKKRIYLNAFDMNCAGHYSAGLWTHPDDQASTYKDAEYWTHVAQVLERGRFDAIFIADVLGVYDVYEGSRDAAIRHGVQAPLNDPAFVVPIMAQATKHLGFGLTASTSHEHPYIFARRMSTLDHLTKGRIGWNVVTSYLKSASKNIGKENQIGHSERYAVADEYMEVVYKLWEGSWEEDAVVVDKEKGIYADPEKVHDIQHEGKYFKVPGAHLSEPSPQRTPVIFQAGASSTGQKFAAKHAELVFISTPTPQTTKQTIQSLRQEAEAAGRNPEDIKIIASFTPIIGETQEAANQKFEEYKKHISYEGALALFGGWTGIDFSGYDPDDKLEYVKSEAIQSVVENFTKADPSKEWTVREAAEFVGIGGLGHVEVGTPESIADAMEALVDLGIDGFNISYVISPGTFEEFVDHVVPVLQERGLVQKEYEEGTFRKKLFGNDRLPEHHTVNQYRKQPVLV